MNTSSPTRIALYKRYAHSYLAASTTPPSRTPRTCLPRQRSTPTWPPLPNAATPKPLPLCTKTAAFVPAPRPTAQQQVYSNKSRPKCTSDPTLGESMKSYSRKRIRTALWMYLPFKSSFWNYTASNCLYPRTKAK